SSSAPEDPVGTWMTQRELQAVADRPREGGFVELQRLAQREPASELSRSSRSRPRRSHVSPRREGGRGGSCRGSSGRVRERCALSPESALRCPVQPLGWHHPPCA